MGKVGSSTLSNSIPHAQQVHTLYSDLPPHSTRIKNMSIRRNLVFFTSRKIILQTIKCRTKTKIITVVRNPILRNRSMFFQDLELWLTKHNLEKGGNKSSYYLQPLIDAYVQTFDHSFYLRWFDDELKRLTKVDIRNSKFKNGFSIQANNNYEVLFLKLESMNDNISVLSHFVEKEVSLVNKNISDKKWYSELYKEFKNLPAFECEKNILNSSVCKHLNYE
jgi:hypothetical protein